VVIVPARHPESMVDANRLADVVVTVPASDDPSVSLLEALAVGRPIVALDPTKQPLSNRPKM